MTVKQTLYVFGASGHGKVVAEAASRSGVYQVVGFLDDNPVKTGLRLLDLPVLGGLDSLSTRQVSVALGVGSNRDRLAVLRRLDEAGVTVVSIVHPSAVVSSGVSLGVGSYVGPGAVVHVDAHVGRACILNSCSVVEHDNFLNDGVHLSPNATLGGNVTIGEGAHVGLGAAVLPGLTIGAWAVIGAGAVVTKALPIGVAAAGVPARILPSPTPPTVEG